MYNAVGSYPLFQVVLCCLLPITGDVYQDGAAEKLVKTTYICYLYVEAISPGIIINEMQ